MGELQLHLKAMYKLKEADHRTYDFNRILNGEFSKLVVSNMVNESMIGVEDTSKCVTNEEPMIELVTVTSKDDDNIVVDKVTNNNDNVRKILVISKETLGTETMEKVDKVDAEEGKIVVKDDDLKITSDVEKKLT